jgi:hypothetical protein
MSPPRAAERPVKSEKKLMNIRFSIVENKPTAVVIVVFFTTAARRWNGY